MYPLVALLDALGIPLTRENYLMHAYPDCWWDYLDEPMDAELESMLPREIRIQTVYEDSPDSA